jgi:hypothetical protein
MEGSLLLKSHRMLTCHDPNRAAKEGYLTVNTWPNSFVCSLRLTQSLSQVGLVCVQAHAGCIMHAWVHPQ